MKAVILAGGFGSRLSEETQTKPKPMVEIGDKPILWHILKIYASYGVNDFIICCGYKGYVIKEYFKNYSLHASDVIFSTDNNTVEVIQKNTEKWKITLIDTGENTMTGGRLKKVFNYIKNEEAFCFTYGDGVGNVNISDLIAFHKKHKKLATVTAVRPQARYGAITFGPNDQVDHFEEKPEGDGSWINGGFFVLEPKVLDLIEGDQTSWEAEPLKKLAVDSQLMDYRQY
jgi:glucose-1-phosphate cytidylyltransferase